MCLHSLSRDSMLPKLTSNTKQQLLFYGCVQAEPGHLHWVTGLLAVFVVSSKVCIFSYSTDIVFSTQYKIPFLYRFATIAVKFTHLKMSVMSEETISEQWCPLLVTVNQKKEAVQM